LTRAYRPATSSFARPPSLEELLAGAYQAGWQLYREQKVKDASVVDRNELAHLHRSEVSADFSVITIAPERYKTKVRFVLPLSGAAR